VVLERWAIPLGCGKHKAAEGSAWQPEGGGSTALYAGMANAGEAFDGTCLAGLGQIISEMAEFVPSHFPLRRVCN
jgi:hypothetical protein